MTSPRGAAPSAKGALVRVAHSDGAKKALTFQYNPGTLRRTFEPRMLGGTSDTRGQAVRYAGAATQTISVECQFSAVDAVGSAGIAGQYGVMPQVAALELMAFPSVADVDSAEGLLSSGGIEVVPPPADAVLFVWGKQSVLPVQLTSVTVMEEFFDSDLWPIRATVEVSMRALTYSDVDPSSLAHRQFRSWQSSMETLAGYALGGYSGGS